MWNVDFEKWTVSTERNIYLADIFQDIDWLNSLNEETV